MSLIWLVPSLYLACGLVVFIWLFRRDREVAVEMSRAAGVPLGLLAAFTVLIWPVCVVGELIDFVKGRR